MATDLLKLKRPLQHLARKYAYTRYGKNKARGYGPPDLALRLRRWFLDHPQVSFKKLADHCGVSVRVVGWWLDGTCLPRGDAWVRLKDKGKGCGADILRAATPEDVERVRREWQKRVKLDRNPLAPPPKPEVNPYLWRELPTIPGRLYF